MLDLIKGRYTSRMAADLRDIAACQRLRSLAFGAVAADPFDARCDHVMVEDNLGALVCAFRILPVRAGDAIPGSYSAQYYDLTGLTGFPGPMVEMGRFCVDPAVCDADVLRVAWGAMTRYVDARGVRLLFGCASFRGTDARVYLDAFALLRDRHLAPVRWRPGIKAPEVFDFATGLGGQADAKRALRVMPPLLRTYLMMGGWVSDHAVIDRDMGTLHVFTGVEVAAIPPARARLLRALAG